MVTLRDTDTDTVVFRTQQALQDQVYKSMYSDSVFFSKLYATRSFYSQETSQLYYNNVII